MAAGGDTTGTARGGTAQQGTAGGDTEPGTGGTAQQGTTGGTAQQGTAGGTAQQGTTGGTAQGTTGGTAQGTTGGSGQSGTMANRDLDDARSTYNVDLTGAAAVAHFTASATSQLTGVAAVTGDNRLVVSVKDAKPGRYSVFLTKDKACGGTDQPMDSQARGDTAAGRDTTAEAAKSGQGDKSLGFLTVDSDGTGRLEAVIAKSSYDKNDDKTHAVMIRSDESGAASTGTLRGVVACADMTATDEAT